jgi:hypothetical protein
MRNRDLEQLPTYHTVATETTNTKRILILIVIMNMHVGFKTTKSHCQELHPEAVLNALSTHSLSCLVFRVLADDGKTHFIFLALPRRHFQSSEFGTILQRLPDRQDCPT